MAATTVERAMHTPAPTPALPGGTNSERLARCRKVLDSLAAAGIAVAASGLLAGLLIAV
jgi:hypothetical protein